MKKEKLDFTFWLTIGLGNAIVFYLTYIFFPSYVVFGNATLSPIAAIILTSTILTLLLSIVKPIVKSVKLKVKSDLAINLLYGAANILGV